MSPAHRPRTLVGIGVTALLAVVLAVGLASAAPLAADGSTAAVAGQDQQANEPPVAAFEFSPSQPEPGETIVLNASASHDPDGEIVTYRWDFDGDGEVDAEGGPNRRLAFPRAGEFTVRLTVVDNDSATDTTSRVIEVVGDQPPEARLNVSPSPVIVGETVTLDPTASSDADGQIETWELDVDGDGTFEEAFDSPTTLRTRYDTPGSYEVTLRVTDNDGLTGTATVEVVVESPTTTASGSPTRSPASPATGPADGQNEGPPNSGPLLPVGGLVIAGLVAVLALVGAGGLLYRRTAVGRQQTASAWSTARGGRAGTGGVGSSLGGVLLAIVLVGVLIGGPVFLLNRRFVGPVEEASGMAVGLVQVGAFALLAVVGLVSLLLAFLRHREAQSAPGQPVGPFGTGAFRWMTVAFGLLASILLTVGLATLLLAVPLPSTLALAGWLVMAAVTVVPLLLAVLLVALTLG